MALTFCANKIWFVWDIVLGVAPIVYPDQSRLRSGGGFLSNWSREGATIRLLSGNHVWHDEGNYITLHLVHGTRNSFWQQRLLTAAFSVLSL